MFAFAAPLINAVGGKAMLYAGIAVIALAGVMVVRHELDARAAAEAKAAVVLVENAKLAADNKNNLVAMEALNKQRDAAEAAAAQASKVAEGARQAIAALRVRTAARSGRPGDDAPMAPVLLLSIDGIRDILSGAGK